MLDLQKTEEVGGTYLITHILEIKIDQMMQIFGKPHIVGSIDGKTQVQWAFYIPDTKEVFTIYDYKEERSINEVTRWHVGGKNAMIIKDYLEKIGFDLNDKPYNF